MLISPIFKLTSTGLWKFLPIFTLFTSPVDNDVGWTVAAVALIAIALFPRPQDGRHATQRQQMNKINLDAPSHGAFYAMLMSVASVGYALADAVAGDLFSDVETYHLGALSSQRDGDVVLQPIITTY